MPTTNYGWLSSEIFDHVNDTFEQIGAAPQSVIIDYDPSCHDIITQAGQVADWVLNTLGDDRFVIVICNNYIAITILSYGGPRVYDARDNTIVRVDNSVGEICLPDGQVLERLQSYHQNVLTDYGLCQVIEDSDECDVIVSSHNDVTFNSFSPGQVLRCRDIDAERRSQITDVGIVSNTVTTIRDGDVFNGWTAEFCENMDRRVWREFSAGLTINGCYWFRIGRFGTRSQRDSYRYQQLLASTVYSTLRYIWRKIIESCDSNKQAIWRRIIDGLRFRVTNDSLFVTLEPTDPQTRYDENCNPTTRTRDSYTPINIEISPFHTDNVSESSLIELLVESQPLTGARQLRLFYIYRVNYESSPDLSVNYLLAMAQQAMSESHGREGVRSIPERTFGVEIEVVSVDTSTAAQYLRHHGLSAEPEGYNHDIRTWWKCVPDSSLLSGRGPDIQQPSEIDDDEMRTTVDTSSQAADCGFDEMDEESEPCCDVNCIRCSETAVEPEEPGTHSAEIVSPILTYGSAQHWRDLHTVVEALQESGAQVDRRCGFHVHVGVNDLSMSQITDIVNIYTRTSWLFDQLLDRSRRNNFNCRHLSQSQLDDLNECMRQNNQPVTGETFRYTSINVVSYLRQGTIEFRQHQGTLDIDKINNWIRLCVGLVQAVAENRLSAPRAYQYDENGILGILDRIVDGPTALWFVNRRRHLNSLQDQPFTHAFDDTPTSTTFGGVDATVENTLGEVRAVLSDSTNYF